MAKESGLGDNFYVGIYDLSGDVNALSRIGGGPTPIDVTAINKSAFERIGGKRDGGIDFSTLFNVATDQEHDALKGLPTADVQMMYCRGTVLGNPGAAIIAKQANYDWTRGEDGSLQGAVQALANGYGVEWGRLGTAGKRTDTAATNGASIDGAASSSFGLQMYVHLFSFTGTSVTIKLQESSDDGGGDAFANVTGATTAALTTPGTVRIATATNLAVERYLRVVTTGTFSSAVFAVLIVRNQTAPEF